MDDEYNDSNSEYIKESSEEISDKKSNDDENTFIFEDNIVNKDNEDNLIGGLEIETSEDINIPDMLIDQIIGQERARDVIRKAAKQHRHVMMIGSPGTGKSMLSKAMTEIMPKENLQDILIYDNPDDQNAPRVRTVPSGKGELIINAHREEVDKQKSIQRKIMILLIIGIILYSLYVGSLLFGIIAAAVIYFLYRYVSKNMESDVPNLLINNKESEEAPFEDATGAHAGALLGDVRHDPFQSGGMATPSHDRVEPGAIHKADNGVLFIDEINTLDIRSQQKLMTAIQEGEFAITGQSERSSGAMVQTDPVPTNFIMVAAGNMDAIENMHPALRDRVRGYGYEVYMNDTIEDTPENRRKYARFVAQEVHRDGDIPHFTREAIKEIILEAQRRAGEDGKLTLQLRNLGGLVRTAGDIAIDDDKATLTTKEHVLRAKQMTQSIEQQYVDEQVQRRQNYSPETDSKEAIGKVNGLAVMGDDSGIVIPVMSKVAESQHNDQGNIIATGKLKDIAQEAVSNVSAIIKDISNKDLTGKDIHIQFVQTYEGVQGDSASVTVATAMVSALEDIPVKQDIAMTGSLSVRGDVLPVGGVTHKIEAAAKMGMNKVLIPYSNKQDVMIEDEYKDQIEVIPVKHINEVIDIALVDDPKGNRQKLIEKLSEMTNAAKLPSEVTQKY